MLAALLGLERENAVHKDKRVSFAGIRTFAFIGLLGALSQVLRVYSEIFSVLLAGGFLLLVVTAYAVSSFKSKTIGATTELAAILAFINGILCANDQYVLATAVTLTVLFVLHFRGKLHKIAEKVSRKELVSTIEFMVIAFVVLPLLPNKGFGPYEIFNPYVIWLMVVLISGISFVSYVAVKAIGVKRGIGATGFFAGLVSSTPLVMSFSEQSKKNPKIIDPYVFAVVIASSATFFRILLEVFVINKDILVPLLVPMLTMGIVGIFCAVFFWVQKGEGGGGVSKEVLKMESPFQLKPALKFGVFFALVFFVSKMMQIYFGTKGVYLAALFSGFVDVDAITVSMANLSKNGLSNEVAVTSITLAAMVNTLAKAGIFALFGHRKVAKLIGIAFAVVLCAGFVSLLFI